MESKLNSLKAAGSTSADMGMKWATALLDPAFRPVVTSLQATRTRDDGNGGTETYNIVNPNISDVPALYTTGQVLKIIILMGDGANDWSFHLSDPNKLIDPDVPESHALSDYRGPDSHLYEIAYTDDVFQYRYRTNNHSYRRYSERYCDSRYWTCVYENVDKKKYFLYSTYYNDYTDIEEGVFLSPSQFNDLPSTLNGYESTTRLTWEAAWGMMTPDFYSRWTNDNQPDQQFSQYGPDSISPSEKDDRMADICAEADSAGIVVFTIAFEMSNQTSAADRLAACASSEGSHYDATTVNIKQAFGSIAANVQKLRLTQ